MIGDVLLSTIICKNLKTWNPNIIIDFIANENTLDVIKNNPYIDNLIVYKKSFSKDKLAFFKFLLSHYKKKYDYVIDAYGKLESLLITIFSNSNKKIGYDKPYSRFFYNIPIKRQNFSENKLQLSIVHRIQLLEPIMGTSSKSTDYPIYISNDEIGVFRKKFDKNLGGLKKPIMINAIGSSIEKTYPIEYMSKLIDHVFIVSSSPLILNYMPNQKRYVDDLIKKLNPKTQKAIKESLTPNSLRDLIISVSLCDAVIGNEGGAINIGKGLSKPTFAIFSPFIDPLGWHTEKKHKTMAVHLKDYFHNELDIKHIKNIINDKKEVKKLYLKLTPNLFQKKLTGFLENLNKQ